MQCIIIFLIPFVSSTKGYIFVDMQRDKQVSASNLIEIISDTEWVALLETWKWEMFDILWL